MLAIKIGMGKEKGTLKSLKLSEKKSNAVRMQFQGVKAEKPSSKKVNLITLVEWGTGPLAISRIKKEDHVIEQGQTGH